MTPLSEENLGVVVVDDDPIFRDLICASVAKKSRFCLFQAGSEEELRAVLNTQRVDCIVLDYDLGGDNGLTIKRRIDESYLEHPPTIMMTGDGRESTAIRAFRMGVGDYLPKRGLSAEAVVESVLKVVEEDRQNTLAKTEHRRLVEASLVDVVTGLEGRSRLDERLSRLASLSPAARSRYALVVVEFVQHRRILERFGLKTSDQALRAFGRTLQGLARSSDVCARYSDDTFVLIVDVQSEREPPAALCERLTAGLHQRFSVAAAEMMLSARVGATVLSDDGSGHATSGADLMSRALRTLAPLDGENGVPETASTETPQPAAGPNSLRRAVAASPTQAAPAAPAADALRTTDRRGAARQRIFKRGLIHLVDRKGTLNCLVRNISTTGAGLRIETPFAVPLTFELEILGSSSRRMVEVRWQTAVDVGVRFSVTDPS